MLPKHSRHNRCGSYLPQCRIDDLNKPMTDPTRIDPGIRDATDRPVWLASQFAPLVESSTKAIKAFCEPFWAVFKKNIRDCGPDCKTNMELVQWRGVGATTLSRRAGGKDVEAKTVVGVSSMDVNIVLLINKVDIAKDDELIWCPTLPDKKRPSAPVKAHAAEKKANPSTEF